MTSNLAGVASMRVDDLEEEEVYDIPTASTGVTFTLMTYNVLAQCYVKSSFFPYCDPKALRWKRRSAMLMDQIKEFRPRPDILCLQECDQYDTFWQGQMAAIGYTSLYLKKTGAKKDGVGLFWKPEKFSVLGGENVSLNEALHEVTDEDLRGRVIRDNVGILAHFQCIDNPATEFLVASTHLFWDPAQADVKLVQTKHMLGAIDAYLSTQLESAALPVFLAGDFNSLPDSDVVRHVLGRGFASAYSTYDAETGEPRFTNVNGVVQKMNAVTGQAVGTEPAFVGTLDYIFYHKSSVKVLDLLPLLDYDTAVGDGGALPNQTVGSDHLPLMATFVFK